MIDTESHGLWHTLYNLESPTGIKLLKKGVRNITYFPPGYYLIEDNNEDELINRGDVRGGFRANDYQEWYSVLADDGTIDNSETLINSLRMLKHRGFVGRFNICKYVIEDGRWIENEINDQNQSEFTSAMWADHGIWGMNVIDETGYRHHFFRQGDFMINYAHEVLINCCGSIFLEKDGTWFLRLLY